jgi:hypothetical protein
MPASNNQQLAKAVPTSASICAESYDKALTPAAALRGEHYPKMETLGCSDLLTRVRH